MDMNKPVAWALITKHSVAVVPDGAINHPSSRGYIPLYTHPVKELTDEEIDSVVYELRQKSFDPKRWLDVYTVAIETIIQLRDELAILRKAQSKPSKKCGDSYDTVCPPSICDCQGKAQ